MTVYVVAYTQKEAEENAKAGFWDDTLKEAEAHAKECNAPPTDPHYARYKVFAVEIVHDPTTGIKR